jgi:hypothetical protein
MNDLQNKKLLVLVERHLALESELAAALSALNQKLAAVMSNAGLRGPTPQDLQQLAPMSEDLRGSAAEIGRARQLLLDRINSESEAKFTCIREFVNSLPRTDYVRVDAARREILDRSAEAQANLVHNQASLYYTFDFHRRYLSGVLHGDLEGHHYGANGQPNEVTPGNIIGKTC